MGRKRVNWWSPGKRRKQNGGLCKWQHKMAAKRNEVGKVKRIIKNKKEGSL